MWPKAWLIKPPNWNVHVRTTWILHRKDLRWNRGLIVLQSVVWPRIGLLGPEASVNGFSSRTESSSYHEHTHTHRQMHPRTRKRKLCPSPRSLWSRLPRSKSSVLLGPLLTQRVYKKAWKVRLTCSAVAGPLKGLFRAVDESISYFSLVWVPLHVELRSTQAEDVISCGMSNAQHVNAGR